MSPARRQSLGPALAALGIAAAALGLLSGPHEDGQVESGRPGPPLEAGLVLEQRFPAVADGLVSLELLLATYATEADGTLVLELWDLGEAEPAEEGAAADEARLEAWELPAAALVDNAPRTFRTDAPLEGIGGHDLALRLSRPEPGGRPFTAWTSTGEAWPAGRLYHDGRPLPGDMVVRLRYEPGRLGAVRWRFHRAGLHPGLGLGLVLGMSLGAVVALGWGGREGRFSAAGAWEG